MDKIEYKRLEYKHEGRTIYEWHQSLEEVHVYIAPPPGVTAKMIDCKITATQLTLGIKSNPPFMDEQFAEKAKASESYWTWEDAEAPRHGKELHLIITKGSKGVTWNSLLRGHTEVDPLTQQELQKSLMLERFQTEVHPHARSLAGCRKSRDLTARLAEPGLRLFGRVVQRTGPRRQDIHGRRRLPVSTAAAGSVRSGDACRSVLPVLLICCAQHPSYPPLHMCMKMHKHMCMCMYMCMHMCMRMMYRAASCGWAVSSCSGRHCLNCLHCPLSMRDSPKRNVCVWVSLRMACIEARSMTVPVTSSVDSAHVRSRLSPDLIKGVQQNRMIVDTTGG